MKGFVLAFLLSLGLSFALKVRAHEPVRLLNVDEEIKASEIFGIETFDGSIIVARKPVERQAIADGLNLGQPFEIKGSVIHPEEISEVLKRDLTINKFVEKKPNQLDFN